MGNSRLFTMKDWQKLQEDMLMPYIQAIKEQSDLRDLAKVTMPPTEGMMAEDQNTMMPPEE